MTSSRELAVDGRLDDFRGLCDGPSDIVPVRGRGGRAGDGNEGGIGVDEFCRLNAEGRLLRGKSTVLEGLWVKAGVSLDD